MRAQQVAVVEVEGVLLVTRRVVRRNVERLEVVVLRLDLRAFFDGEAQRGEEAHHVSGDVGDGVEVSRCWRRAGERHVEALARERERAPGPLELVAARRYQLLDALLGGIRPLPHPRTLGRLEAADAPQQLGERALLAEVARAHAGERLEILRGGDLRARPAFQSLEVDGLRRHPRRRAYAALDFASAARSLKALGSDTASCASTLRSISTFARFSPSMKRL